MTHAYMSHARIQKILTGKGGGGGSEGYLSVLWGSEAFLG